MESVCFYGDEGSCNICPLIQGLLTGPPAPPVVYSRYRTRFRASPAPDGVTVAASRPSSNFGNDASSGGAPSSSIESEIVEEGLDTSIPDFPSSSETYTSSSDSEEEESEEEEEEGDIVVQPSQEDVPQNSSSPDADVAILGPTRDGEEEEGDIVVQPSQEHVPPNPSSPNADVAIVGPTKDGPVGLLLALKDPDVLKCPICHLPLSLPVFQCENGHIACASCYCNWNDKCSFCKLEMGYNRCRAIEQVIQSIESPCCYMVYGCVATFSYSQRRDHEKNCSFEPCCCPDIKCEYKGMDKDLYNHFYSQHDSMEFLFNSTFSIRLCKKDNPTYYQERDEKTLFILANAHFPGGYFLVLYCVAPSSLQCAFEFEISTTCGSVQSNAFARKTQDKIPDIFSLEKAHCIPLPFRTSDFLDLKITIWKRQGPLGVASTGTAWNIPFLIL